MDMINNLIKQNFRMINTYYTELLVKSNKFPRVDFESYKSSIEEIDETVFQRAQLEISFQSASRSRGLVGGCSRGEFMELIVRSAH